MDLKKKGIQFPIPSDEDLLLVQSMQQKPVTPKKSPSSSTSGQDTKLSPTQNSNSPVHQEINQRKQVREKRTAGKRKLSSGQLNKLNRDIQITQRHLEVFSELLSEMIPGQEHPEDVEMLSQVATNSQEMQVRVMELVSQVVDQPDLTMVLLEINDRMNSEMARHQRYLAKCANVTKSHKKDQEVCNLVTLAFILKNLLFDPNLYMLRFFGKTILVGKDEFFTIKYRHILPQLIIFL